MNVTERSVKDITIDEYHAAVAISSGGIRCFVKDGPPTYYERYVARTMVSPDSDAKRNGRALHLFCQWPDTWDEHLAVVPSRLRDDDILAQVREEYGKKRSSVSLDPGTEINLRSPAHRAYKEAYVAKAEANGKEFVSEEELGTLKRQFDSIWENPAARKYLEAGAKTEVPHFGVEQATGMAVKALCDIDMAPEVIVDFKTTRMSTSDMFVRDAIDKGYPFQAAWYLDVIGAAKFVIISVRNAPPYESMVYRVPEHRIDQARRSNDSVLSQIAACHATDSWHSLGYGQEIDLEYEFV